MNNQAYYRIPSSNGCDVAVQDRYIVVNCSGVCVLSEPFTSRNTRSDYYLMVLVQGELEMEIGGRTQLVLAGSLLIYPPGTVYQYTKRSLGELVYYWAHFTGYGAQAMLDGCELAANTIYFAGRSASIADNFRLLFKNFVHMDCCSEVAAAAQLTAICVQLRREINGNALVPPYDLKVKIQESLEYIHRNYAYPITVSKLAGIEHLSVSHYCAVFRTIMGVSPQNFIIDLRLKMAVDLMMRTDLSFKQIARTVGYEDQLYFSRLFKSRRGISPKFYVKTLEVN